MAQQQRVGQQWRPQEVARERADEATGADEPELTHHADKTSPHSRREHKKCLYRDGFPAQALGMRGPIEVEAISSGERVERSRRASSPHATHARSITNRGAHLSHVQGDRITACRGTSRRQARLRGLKIERSRGRDRGRRTKYGAAGLSDTVLVEVGAERHGLEAEVALDGIERGRDVVEIEEACGGARHRWIGQHSLHDAGAEPC